MKLKLTAELRKLHSEMHYVGRWVPKTIKPGRVLAHNHIMHTVDMPLGCNGFRAWTWAKAKAKVPRNFKNCNCGWSSLPHVAAGAFKCVSWEEIDGWTKRDALSFAAICQGPPLH
jgi:hypothetical protein